MSAFRGDVHFELGGAAYSLRIGLDAMERYAAATGESLLTGVRALEGFDSDPGGAKRIGDIFWVGLTPRVARGEVADIIDQLGFRQAVEMLGTAVKLAFPPPSPGTGETSPDP